MQIVMVFTALDLVLEELVLRNVVVGDLSEFAFLDIELNKPFDSIETGKLDAVGLHPMQPRKLLLDGVLVLFVEVHKRFGDVDVFFVGHRVPDFELLPRNVWLDVQGEAGGVIGKDVASKFIAVVKVLQFFKNLPVISSWSSSHSLEDVRLGKASLSY